LTPKLQSHGFALIATVVRPGTRTYGEGVRLFVTDGAGDDWSELTSDQRPAVRLAAPDLQRAQRGAARIRAEHQDLTVILDILVAVPGDFRTARASLAADHRQTVRYAGTVDGLAGLVADIELAGVADGVTLIPVGPRQDLRGVGRDVLNRLALRVRASA